MHAVHPPFFTLHARDLVEFCHALQAGLLPLQPLGRAIQLFHKFSFTAKVEIEIKLCICVTVDREVEWAYLPMDKQINM